MYFGIWRSDMSDMEHDANDERTTLMTSDVEHSSREIERLRTPASNDSSYCIF